MSFFNRELTVGDHLVTKRLGYTHHGIYLGRDKVILTHAVKSVEPNLGDFNYAA
ncbi:lecithin retinol acyltransferase family protein [Psychrobacter pocilloporae]|nr:lecithin retinol acyltransferase family protein [Psychrobacter pocilloporae]